MYGPTLTTDRLVLRPLDQGEVGEAYVGWLADPRVNRFLETRHAEQTHASIQAFVESMNASGHSLLWGVFPRASGQHVGNIKLGPINPHYRRADIGLLIGEPAEWGKGYAVEMIGAVTCYGLETLGLKKLTAGCYSANEASRKAFVANGFREVGRRMDHWLVEGEWMDDVILERVAVT
ncbi:MAG: N-acetyltransferase [Brevundimonas sp.]|nr:MAG: N-acetyltransferase [Brevundimonas sp.]